MYAPQEFPALEKSYDYTSDYFEPDPELADSGLWLNNNDFDVVTLRREPPRVSCRLVGMSLSLSV
jgi:hypothetical protein